MSARATALVRGSLALIAMRAALLVLASLPVVYVSADALSSGAARRPYFADVRGALPVGHLLRLVDALPDLGGVFVLSATLALLGQQVLVAGALWWLAPTRRRDGRRVAGLVLRTGASWLGPMLRVALTAALASSAGIAALDALVELVTLRGDVAGWSGRTLNFVLPTVQGLLTLAWMALVGAWAFWCRVLLIADDRRRVRSAGLLVFAVFRRAPLRGPLLFMAVTSAALFGSAALLVVWRQLPPRSVEGVVAIGALWLLAIVAQAWLWHALLRAARLLYDERVFEELRVRPDAPWGLVRWLRVRLGASAAAPR